MAVTSGFLEYAQLFGKEANYLVKLTLDRCSLTYASGTCTANDLGDGSRCWYTFPSCQATYSFSKTTKDRYFSLTQHPAVHIRTEPTDFLGGYGQMELWSGSLPSGWGGSANMTPTQNSGFLRTGSYGLYSLQGRYTGGTGTEHFYYDVSGIQASTWCSLDFYASNDVGGNLYVTVTSGTSSVDASGLTWTSGNTLLTTPLTSGVYTHHGTSFKTPSTATTSTVYRLKFQPAIQPVNGYFHLDDVYLNGPIQPGVLSLPYLNKFIENEQVIKLFDGETSPRKITLKFNNDYNVPIEDGDKSTYNTTTKGEYFRNLIARNQNYDGRPIQLYRGFTGLPFSDYQILGDMTVTGFNVQPDSTSIEAVDILALTNKTSIPFQISESNYIITTSGITSGVTTLKVTSNREIPNPLEYSGLNVVIEVGGTTDFQDGTNPTLPKEYMVVTGISGVGQGNEYILVSRGRYGTTAQTFSPVSGVASFRWRHVYIAGTEGTESTTGAEDWNKNAVDITYDLLRWCKISGTQIDLASFTDQRDKYYPSLNFSRKIIDPVSVGNLLKEIRQTLTASIFVNSDNLIEFCVLGPPSASEVIPSIDDTSHIIQDSVFVEDDPSMRITRVSCYYGPIVEDPGESASDYNHNVTLVDGELETSSNYGDVKPSTVYNRWFRLSEGSATIADILRRRINLLKDGLRTLTFAVEVKDAYLNLGDYINVSCKEVLDINGDPSSRLYYIISRKDVEENITEYEAIEITSIAKGYMMIGPSGMASTYISGTQTDRGIGYWSDENGLLDDTTGKVIGYKFS